MTTTMNVSNRLGVGLLFLALSLVMSGCASTSGSGGTTYDPVLADEPTIMQDERSDMVSTAQSAAASEPLVEKRVSRLDPKYHALARAVRSGKSKGIVDEAGKILSTNPHDPLALNTLALFHFRMGRTGAAKILLDRILEKNKPNAAIYNNLAIVFLEEGDQGSAILHFKRALREDDDHPAALGNLGSLYAQGGDYSKALHLLEKSYRMNRSNLAIANNYAISLRAAKKYDAAAKVYEDIIKRNSKDVNALLNYAILLIDFMNKPKDGLALVYKVKFMEAERTDVLARANALEKKAKSELK